MQKPKVTEFFKSVLKDSDRYKPELIKTAVEQFNSFYKKDISCLEVLDLLKWFVNELKNSTPTN